MRNLAFYMFILYPGPDPQSAALCMGLHFVEKMTISTKLTVAYCARNMWEVSACTCTFFLGRTGFIALLLETCRKKNNWSYSTKEFLLRAKRATILSLNLCFLGRSRPKLFRKKYYQHIMTLLSSKRVNFHPPINWSMWATAFITKTTGQSMYVSSNAMWCYILSFHLLGICSRF